MVLSLLKSCYCWKNDCLCYVASGRLLFTVIISHHKTLVGSIYCWRIEISSRFPLFVPTKQVFRMYRCDGIWCQLTWTSHIILNFKCAINYFFPFFKRKKRKFSEGKVAWIVSFLYLLENSTCNLVIDHRHQFSIFFLCCK